MFSLYKIICKVNNKIYIGYTQKPIEIRFQEHLKNAHQHDFKFARAIKKHGENQFSVYLIETVSNKNQAYQREKELITEYDSIKYGYNTHIGGRGGNTGAYHKVGLFGPDNPMFGRSMSSESKEKANKSRKLWFQSPEGIKFREESSKRWKSDKNPGKNKSEETKKKISNSKRGKPCHKLRKSYIITFPDGHKETIIGLTEFCKKYNLDQGNMNSVANGKWKTCKGFSVQKLP